MGKEAFEEKVAREGEKSIRRSMAKSFGFEDPREMEVVEGQIFLPFFDVRTMGSCC